MKVLVEFHSSLDTANRVIEIPDRQLVSSEYICEVVSATLHQMMQEKIPPTVTVVE